MVADKNTNRQKQQACGRNKKWLRNKTMTEQNKQVAVQKTGDRKQTNLAETKQIWQNKKGGRKQ